MPPVLVPETKSNRRWTGLPAARSMAASTTAGTMPRMPPPSMDRMRTGRVCAPSFMRRFLLGLVGGSRGGVPAAGPGGVLDPFREGPGRGQGGGRDGGASPRGGPGGGGRTGRRRGLRVGAFRAQPPEAAREPAALQVQRDAVAPQPVGEPLGGDEEGDLRVERPPVLPVAVQLLDEVRRGPGPAGLGQVQRQEPGLVRGQEGRPAADLDPPAGPGPELDAGGKGLGHGAGHGLALARMRGFGGADDGVVRAAWSTSAAARTARMAMPPSVARNPARSPRTSPVGRTSPSRSRNRTAAQAAGSCRRLAGSRGHAPWGPAAAASAACRSSSGGASAAGVVMALTLGSVAAGTGYCW